MKLNNKGFAISSIIYSILILFLILIFGLLSILGTRKLMFDKTKSDIMHKLNGDTVDGVGGGLKIEPDTSGASAPDLANGQLTPIVYKDGVWVVANTDRPWYNYGSKLWANAVILETGVTKNVGEAVNIKTEVAQMYVWIPRYEYSIPVGSKGQTNPNAISIKFIDKNQTTADKGYTIHPGFSFDGVTRDGIWVGKFETTSEAPDERTLFTCTDRNCTQKVTIKPSYKAAYGSIANQFFASRSVETQYGLTDLDVHMAKYLEWTTISFLTNSIYGRCFSTITCEEINFNNSSGTYTGNSSTGSYVMVTTEGIAYAYDETTYGILASTTGNITGVYDMNGGSQEHVMGVLLDSNNLPRSGYMTTSSSGFNGMLYDGSMKTDGLAFPESKYYDAFTSSDPTVMNSSVFTAINNQSSMAGTFKETLKTYTNTSNWYKDYLHFVTSSYPWFSMGGHYSNNTYAGIFNSYKVTGASTTNAGFRLVLVVNS